MHLLFSYLSFFVYKNVCEDEDEGGGAEDKVHHGVGDLRFKEIKVTVHSIRKGVYDAFGNAVVFQLSQGSSH